jgi:hypothetical protein
MPFYKILNKGQEYLTLLPQADFKIDTPDESGEDYILRFVLQCFYTQSG